MGLFNKIGDMASMVRQAQQLGGKMEELAESLKSRRATGAAGGGLVEVEVNGLQEVLHCRIEPAFFAQGDRELIEDLVRSATNDALGKAKQLHAEAMQSMMGGMADLPGISEAMAKLTGDK
jgi:DNA-binding YbaB/EbfC family protein